MSPGTPMWPSSRAAGSTFIDHRVDDDAVALRLEQRRGARAPRPRRVTSSVTVPPRSGETCSSSKSSMLIRSAPSAWVISAKTPGRSGTWTLHALERARVGVGARRACAGGCRPPRRSSAAMNPSSRCLERGLDLLDPAAVARRAPRAARSALSRKMSIHIRGFAPAIRVMSRSEPPAFASGSWPSTRRRAGLVDDDVREHVREVARQRDELVVRGRVDRDAGTRRASAAKPWTSAVPRRRRSAAVGVRNHVAPSKSPADGVLGAVRLLARRSGGRRRSAREPPAAATTLAFVEPTSVTVVSSPVAAEHRGAPAAGSAAIGAATTTRSAPATASPSEPAPPRPRRARPRRRARPGPGPSRRTATPRRARGQADGGADQPGADDGEPLDRQASSAHQLGEPEREVERLARRSGADRRASRSARRGAPRRAPPSRRGTRSRRRPCTRGGRRRARRPPRGRRAKKPSISAMIASKWRVLRPFDGREAVRRASGRRPRRPGARPRATARRSGGSRSATRSAPIRAISVSRPGIRSGFSRSQSSTDLVGRRTPGPSLTPIGLWTPEKNSTCAPSSARVRSPIQSMCAEQSYQSPVSESRRVRPSS